jgi:hypothetical protein
MDWKWMDLVGFELKMKEFCGFWVKNERIL